MSLSSADVASDFKDALQDLKINSRPEISTLTLIAKENTEHAQAISRELENHIKTTRPEWKLPALYVLDSIVKNVGTPYTVYLGRNLYRTFMDAYSLMNPGTRKAMEGLLNTWKQPVPESMDTRPVFAPEVTRDIENALMKFRTIAVQQNSLPARPPLPPHGLPARPVANSPWRNTPTPPQNATRYSAANDPRVRAPYPPAVQHNQFSMPATPPTQFQPSPPYQQPTPMTSVDLESLKLELSKHITSAKTAWALSPSDIAVQQKLKALLDLETVLKTQTLPPQQLEAVRMQIQNLTPTPMPGFASSISVAPPAIHSPQQQALPTFPPANAPPNLAQLLASVQPHMPLSSTPVVPAPPATPSLADLLRRVSSPAQSSAIAAPVTSFNGMSYSNAPSMLPASGSTPAPSNNLAQLLAQFNQPSGGTPVSQPILSPPTPLPFVPAQTAASAPALGSAEWLLSALKGIPNVGTPSNVQNTPLSSESMTRQASAPTAFETDIELSTASMKKPRLNLISKLYEAYANQCVTCGRRFEATPQGKEKKARHMDWHFKVKDPDAAKRGIHRSWYITEKEWIDYREIDETSPNQNANGIGAATAIKKEAKDKYVPVPTDTALLHAPCPICQEKFEPQWHVEANDFVWMDAVKVNGKIYHATCWEEYSRGSTLVAPSTPDSVLGKRKAEAVEHSGSRLRV